MRADHASSRLRRPPPTSQASKHAHVQLGQSAAQSAAPGRQDVSGRAHPPNGKGDPAYPIDVGAEIGRQSTVRAVGKRLRKRMLAGEGPPTKPKLVWTAEELAGTHPGPAERDRANPLDPVERNPATSVGIGERPATLRDNLEVDSHESTVAAHHESVSAPRRGPGRPGWTRDLFEERWREAQAATHEPRTFAALAANFKAHDGTIGGVGGDHLRRLRRVRFPD
jgi:hypothetical protein